MSKGSLLDSGDWDTALPSAYAQVSRMQTKLHQWAVTDKGFRFDDIFNFVTSPAVLLVAFDRVCRNKGARSAGVDGWTAQRILIEWSREGFTSHLRDMLRTGVFRPSPVRERLIPKPGRPGKMRRLGIPTVVDRTVQGALKLVLEPIFEADFMPVSYGFRPERRAQDAMTEIHLFGTHSYRWVLDADIEACFDQIDHAALMDRVRGRIKDKRVLSLVKAFLKAGIMTELGRLADTTEGTPQGGILSPLLANIALSVLDEYFHTPWLAGGEMSTSGKRAARVRRGAPVWRLVRYADDFVVLVRGDANREHAQQAKEEAARVLATVGLRLSQDKTHIRHLREGFDFLGQHLVWRRKQGSHKWHVYTFISRTALRSVKAKIRAWTHRSSQQPLGVILTQLNQIMRGWAQYFRHTVAKSTFAMVDNFTWWRVIRLLTRRYRWRWKDVRAALTTPTGRWVQPSADGVSLCRIAAIPVTRYRYRGTKIPNPFVPNAA